MVVHRNKSVSLGFNFGIVSIFSFISPVNRYVSPLLYTENQANVNRRKSSTFKGKKTGGYTKKLLIFTVSLQLGERNYRFISVTNRYGILIFLVNVVENHKNYLPTFKRRKIGRVFQIR